MRNFYIVKPGDSTPTGPMSMEAIHAGLADGSITQDYLYCQQGAQQWLPVSTLQYNRAIAPVPTPAPGLTKPANQLVWSILCTFFCCLPLGVFAIIKSASVDSLWNQGKHAEAISAAKTAKICNLISLGLNVLIIFFYFIAIVAMSAM